MKRLLTLAFAFAALLVLIGCESGTTPDKPTVTTTVLTGGGGLKLEWDADANADGFIIYNDGVALDTVTAVTYNDTIPCMKVEVSAYAGDKESDKAEVDCTPMETPSLIVYGSGDTSTTHPSGLGFNSSGTAAAYSISDSTNDPFIDYWIHSVSSSVQEFASPSQASPPFNNEVNTTKNSSLTDYAAAIIADPVGGYTAPTTIASGAVYYFWIDPNNDGWGSSNDYFGKIQVSGVNGYAVTLKIAYQKIAGLRWCVTP